MYCVHFHKCFSFSCEMQKEDYTHYLVKAPPSRLIFKSFRGISAEWLFFTPVAFSLRLNNTYIHTWIQTYMHRATVLYIPNVLMSNNSEENYYYQNRFWYRWCLLLLLQMFLIFLSYVVVVVSCHNDNWYYHYNIFIIIIVIILIIHSYHYHHYHKQYHHHHHHH